MPGPSRRLSRWAPTTTTRSGSPLGVSAMTFHVVRISLSVVVLTWSTTPPASRATVSWPIDWSVPDDRDVLAGRAERAVERPGDVVVDDDGAGTRRPAALVALILNVQDPALDERDVARREAGEVAGLAAGAGSAPPASVTCGRVGGDVAGARVGHRREVGGRALDVRLRVRRDAIELGRGELAEEGEVERLQDRARSPRRPAGPRRTAPTQGSPACRMSGCRCSQWRSPGAPPGARGFRQGSRPSGIPGIP